MTLRKGGIEKVKSLRQQVTVFRGREHPITTRGQNVDEKVTNKGVQRTCGKGNLVGKTQVFDRTVIGKHRRRFC